MSPSKTSKSPKHFVLTKEQRDILKVVYKEISENARYYDASIWQIPSVTVAINAFLIGQTFSDGLRGETWVQALVVLSASFFTFVLLIALVKHRLHKRGKDLNLKEIYENGLEVDEKFYHEFDLQKELHKLEDKPGRILRRLAGMKANRWLMSVMLITIMVDLVIFVGIVCGKW